MKFFVGYLWLIFGNLSTREDRFLFKDPTGVCEFEQGLNGTSSFTLPLCLSRYLSKTGDP